MKHSNSKNIVGIAVLYLGNNLFLWLNLKEHQVHGISHDFRLKAKLDYECTKLAKIIAQAVLKKGSHAT